MTTLKMTSMMMTQSELIAVFIDDSQQMIDDEEAFHDQLAEIYKLWKPMYEAHTKELHWTKKIDFTMNPMKLFTDFYELVIGTEQNYAITVSDYYNRLTQQAGKRSRPIDE